MQWYGFICNAIISIIYSKIRYLKIVHKIMAPIITGVAYLEEIVIIYIKKVISLKKLHLLVFHLSLTKAEQCLPDFYFCKKVLKDDGLKLQYYL